RLLAPRVRPAAPPRAACRLGPRSLRPCGPPRRRGAGRQGRPARARRVAGPARRQGGSRSPVPGAARAPRERRRGGASRRRRDARRPGTGRRRRARGRGLRPGHPARAARPRLRAVLHHARARHRPRPRRGAPGRRGARRADRGRRAAGRRGAAHGPAAVRRPAGDRRMKPRVLIVDDEERMAGVIASTLARVGYECEQCPSGDAALAALEERPADVVVTDWKMPGMDGLALLRRLRARWPAMPVVLLTAYGSVPSAVAAMREGAFDYVTKPFDNDELRALVARALDMTRLERENRYLRQEVASRYAPEAVVAESEASRKLLELVRRVALPRRDRRDRRGFPGEAPAGAAGRGAAARGRHAVATGGRPRRHRHESFPAGRDRGRPLPRRPLLPAERHPDAARPAARAPGGHPAARPSLPRAARRRVRTPAGAHARGRRGPRRPRLAGERARARECDRARGRAGARGTDTARGPPPGAERAGRRGAAGRHAAGLPRPRRRRPHPLGARGREGQSRRGGPHAGYRPDDALSPDEAPRPPGVIASGAGTACPE